MLHQSYTEHTISDECAEMLISNRLAYSVVHYHNCEPSKKAVISAFLDIALFSVHPLSGGERLPQELREIGGAGRCDCPLIYDHDPFGSAPTCRSSDCFLSDTLVQNRDECINC
jgi:hypothetical protein